MHWLQTSFRRLLAICLITALSVLSGCNAGEAARVATAMTAHVMCAQIFIAGRDPDWVFDRFLKRAPGLDRVGSFLRYQIDALQRRVTVTLAGQFREAASYADGRGCTVGPAQEAPRRPAVGASVDPHNAPDAVVMSNNPAINAAIEQAFAEPVSGPAQNVAAIVIVHEGRIIAERYADGFTPRTPLHGWSVSKSMVQAMYGVLAHQGRLDVRRPSGIGAWQAPDDLRSRVTIDMLLRQVAGHPFGAENSGFDRASQMLFLAPDTFAAATGVQFDPRSAAWRYSDANYQILSGVLRDTLGGPSDLIDFAECEFFTPLGMRDVTLEFDAAGTPMGAAFFFASARDWARFGWLFANDGMIGDRRILPEGWVEYSRTPTPQAQWGYGAGSWTNIGDSIGAQRRRGWGAPDGSFYANGNFGQTIVIAPRERLVVARFGFSLENGGASLERTMRLTGQVAAALR